MSHNCPTREAWAATLKSLARARHQEWDCLRAALVRYSEWIESSASCERTFAKTAWLRGGQSEDGFFLREEDIIQLQADPLPPDMEDILVRKASQVWARNFGRPRTTHGRRHRIDRGVKRKQVLTLACKELVC